MIRQFEIGGFVIQVKSNSPALNLYFNPAYLLFEKKDFKPVLHLDIDLSYDDRIKNYSFQNLWHFEKLDKTRFNIIGKSHGGATINTLLEADINNLNWKLTFYPSKKNLERYRFTPFFHPMGSLILNYFLVIKDSFFIHASGVNYGGNGLLFTGKSGVGKSTMAYLFEKANGQIIHDDRLLIKPGENQNAKMYNSPMKNVTSVKAADVKYVFSIRHAEQNYYKELHGLSAVNAIVPNVLQHNFDAFFIEKIYQSISLLLPQIRVFELGFKPDMKVISTIDEAINS